MFSTLQLGEVVTRALAFALSDWAENRSSYAATNLGCRVTGATCGEACQLVEDIGITVAAAAATASAEVKKGT